jgi:hypothetical protein
MCTVLLYCLCVNVYCTAVLFVCKCVLYYCHRASNQLQLKINNNNDNNNNNNTVSNYHYTLSNNPEERRYWLQLSLKTLLTASTNSDRPDGIPVAIHCCGLWLECRSLVTVNRDSIGRPMRRSGVGSDNDGASNRRQFAHMLHTATWHTELRSGAVPYGAEVTFRRNLLPPSSG